MNKLFTKIAGAVLGLTMVIGVGTVIVGSLKETPFVAEAAEEATLSFANKAQRTEYSSAKQVWEQNGITLTNEKGSGSIADYANPVRLYANTKVTVEAPGNITKIVFGCSGSSYATAMKNSIGTTATTSVSSNNVNVTLDGSARSFTVAKLTAQVRLNSLTVTYQQSSYTVSFEANLDDYSGDVPTAITYSGTAVKLPAALSQKGYTFNGWNTQADGKGQTYSAGASFTPTGNVTLYGKWSKNTYNVTGNITNGHLDGTTSIEYGEGVKGLFLVPEDSYSFPESLTRVTMGEADLIYDTDYLYDSSTGEIVIYKVTDNVIIEAECLPDGILYGFQTLITNGSVSEEFTEISSNAIIEFTIIPDEGYFYPSDISVLNASYNYEQDTGNVIVTDAKGDVTVTAVCEAKPIYTITTELSGVVADENNPTCGYVGQEIELNFTAEEGCALPEEIEVEGLSEYLWDQNDGFFYAIIESSNITITIAGVEKSLSSISLSTNVGTYKLGETFKMPSVTAIYNLGQEIVTNEATYSCDAIEDGAFVSLGEKTVTISYTYKGVEKTAEYIATVTPNISTEYYYQKVTASKTDWSGEYIIGNDTYSLGNTISSNRVTNIETGIKVDGSNKVTSGADVAKIWTISPVDGGYTIYNAEIGKYLAGNGTKNQAALVSNTNNYTTWTINLSNSTFTIENVGNKTKGVNSILRNNDDYGWACYAGTTGKAPILYEKVSNTVNPLIKISATGPEANTIAPGTVLTKDDFVVTALFGDGSERIVTATSVSGEALEVGENKYKISYTDPNDNTNVKTCEVIVIASNNIDPYLIWEATTIDVWNEEQLTETEVNDWNVVYYDRTATEHELSCEEFEIKLEEDTIDLPYTWSAEDHGKALKVVYNDLETESVSVIVTQKIRSVLADLSNTSDSSLVFSGKCNGVGLTDDEKNWIITSDSNESTFDNNKGIHYGTNSASVQYIQLSSSEYKEGHITQITVDASTGSGVNATLSVTVNGEEFGTRQTLTSGNTTYSFEGNVEAGEIIVRIEKPESQTKALYCKGITVTTSVSTGTIDIANDEQYRAAQRAVVTFAKAFNAAMDTTNNCQTNMESAWNIASQAWADFLTEINVLSDEEKAYALDLIKNATSKYTKDTDEDYSYALERALMTYDICVTKYSMTGFMGETRTLNAYSYNGLSIINKDNSSALLITIISLCSVAAIGGYFFIKKRKEEK